jgi:hypothetical protein
MILSMLMKRRKKNNRYANCCSCGRVVDTLEKEEGGDGHGAQLNNKKWICSEDCENLVTGA